MNSSWPALRGGLLALAAALLFGISTPLVQRAGRGAIGASGYGLSLRLYLLAQRAFGAARTGSVFAFAPFIGAALAIALGDRSLSWGMAAGGALCCPVSRCTWRSRMAMSTSTRRWSTSTRTRTTTVTTTTYTTRCRWVPTATGIDASRCGTRTRTCRTRITLTGTSCDGHYGTTTSPRAEHPTPS